jgi:hypothetical protein
MPLEQVLSITGTVKLYCSFAAALSPASINALTRLRYVRNFERMPALRFLDFSAWRARFIACGELANFNSNDYLLLQ